MCYFEFTLIIIKIEVDMKNGYLNYSTESFFLKKVIRNSFNMCGYLLFFLILFSCQNEEEILPGGDGIDIPAEATTKLMKLSNGLGDWDAGVILGNQGYLTYQAQAGDDMSDDEYLQYISVDGLSDCTILANRLTHLPEIVYCDDATWYFDNHGDTTIVVSRTVNEGVELLDSIPFRFSMVNETREFTKSNDRQVTVIEYINRDDEIQRALKALDKVLDAGDTYTTGQIKYLKKALDKLSPFYYYENVEDIIDSLDLCREKWEIDPDSMIYCFAQYAEKKRKKIVDVTYGITVQTDRVPKEIYCNSAVVRGRIFCPSDDVFKQGTWGILYSQDPNSLDLEHCEGHVEATTLDFAVELRGLDINTTYYYKAYYKFKSKNHGDLHFSYGDPDAQFYASSDFFQGEFKTPLPHVSLISMDAWEGDNWWCNESMGCGGCFTIKLQTENIKYILGMSRYAQNSPDGGWYVLPDITDADSLASYEKKLQSVFNAVEYEYEKVFYPTTSGSDTYKIDVILRISKERIHTYRASYNFSYGSFGLHLN